jgi:hypothetical protein
MKGVESVHQASGALRRYSSRSTHVAGAPAVDLQQRSVATAGRGTGLGGGGEADRHRQGPVQRLELLARASERLTQLEGQVERDLEDARRLREELEDRIALAHVAALGPTSGDTVDRQHVEALLARADALVHETARDLGTDAPETAP